MKKLLVLLVVFGLAASAQAALSLSLSSATVAVHGDVTLSVISSDSSSWTADLVLSEDLVNWTPPAVAGFDGSWTITGAGSSAFAQWESGYDNVAYRLNAAGNPHAGTQFSINIVGVQAGTIYIGLQGTSYPYPEMSTNGPLTLVVTPEPMTMALLGLGGLFLRPPFGDCAARAGLRRRK